ncbi:MAG: outer membrane lipoprotein-sorting protein [Betaproteobacteria bacterium]|nr:outer membrane lipoprotein-sorting protein [Betaproteobacteria bacterium]
MEKFITFVVNRRRWVLAGIVMVTLLFCLQLRQLQVVIDTAKLLPPDHPNVVGTVSAEKLFGSRHVVVVGISAKDGTSAYSPTILNAVVALTTSMADTPGVKRHTLLSASAGRAKAISGSTSELTVEPMLGVSVAVVTAEDAERFRVNVATNPVYQNGLISRDGQLASVSFSIASGAKGFRESMDKIHAAIGKQAAANPGLHYAVAGAPALFAEVERLSARMAFLFPIAVLLIGLIHFEAFRTWQGLVLPLVTALLAVAWGLGIMSGLGIEMDAFNAVTPILILAVAAGHAVQILKRYYEEFERISRMHPTWDPAAANRAAVIESLAKIGPVMLTAGGVAAAGLFSLVTFEIATIRTFGIFTGLGIVSALIIELTFIPALRACLKPPKYVESPAGDVRTDQTTAARSRTWDRFAGVVSAAVLRHRIAVLAGFGMLAAASSFGLLHLNQENSTKSYFGKRVQARMDDALLNEKLAGTNTLFVVFSAASEDRMKDPQVLRVIADTQAYIQGLPDVGKTISIVDFLKQMNQSMNGGAASAYTLPLSQAVISQYLLLYSLSGEPGDFDAYIDYGYKNANLLVWMKNDTSRYANAILKDVRAFVEPRLPPGITLTIGGSAPQAAAISETLVAGKLKNVTQIIIVVFVAGLLVFRSLLAAVYIVVPLLVTVLVNFGVMGLTGIPLNTPNSVASALAIGIGADYSIYLMFRIREEFVRLGDLDAALRETFRTAGLAIVYVASAIIGGYSVLLLSVNFYIHIWFGLLIVLSMIVSAISALVLVPALIKIWPPRHLQATVPTPLLTPAASGRMAMLALGVVSLTLSGAVAIPEARAQTQGLGFGLGQGQVQTPPNGEQLSADVIMERSYQSSRLAGSTSEATFRLVNANGHERIRKTFGATRLGIDGIGSQRVIRFLSPSDVRNTTTLLVERAGEDEVSVYLPALKKTRRLSRNNKKASFVGTDLSYGDMMGHRPGDWIHNLLRSEKIDGASTYVVESRPRTPLIAEETGYSRRTSWIAAETYVPLKVEYFDSANVLLKTILYADIEQVDDRDAGKSHKHQAMRIDVKNAQTNHQTFIKFERFRASSSVNESYFSRVTWRKRSDPRYSAIALVSTPPYRCELHVPGCLGFHCAAGSLRGKRRRPGCANTIWRVSNWHLERYAQSG